ncbi:hypothetical protein KIN20_031294 [Parelaphostrongylus tenuis]|uniref:Uncharacterized protein n=1 Tax=Parelaphostrongylus tenuis TaxID=148309 RepID=A0AAD5R5C0_PARTN|nr:hypothetical protein KIN20_031294 [Parelaphostrongylus tenuis]
MGRHQSGPIMISLLAAIPILLGCGVMLAGQGKGQKLLCCIGLFNTANVRARVAGIATSEEGAKEFVSRLVMQTVFDVLEREDRGAFLPEAVISTILRQVTVTVTYQPMLCQAAILSIAADNVF